MGSFQRLPDRRRPYSAVGGTLAENRGSAGQSRQRSPASSLGSLTSSQEQDGRASERSDGEAAWGALCLSSKKVKVTTDKGHHRLGGIGGKASFAARHLQGGNVSRRAALRRDGQINYMGKLYRSPSRVAKLIVGRASNGWRFWRYRTPRGGWVPLANLKG